MAVNPPCDITSLTLIGTSGKVSNNDALHWLIEGDDEFPGIRKLDGRLPDEFIREWTHSTNGDPSFVESIYQHARNLPPSTWTKIFLGLENIDNTERLSNITIPVQIIWGTNDEFFNKQDQLSLIGALGSNKTVFIKKDGLGHNTHWENGMDLEISKDIYEFLD